MADREYGFRTRAIHAGNIPDETTGARAMPIYQTSAFVFDDTDDAATCAWRATSCMPTRCARRASAVAAGWGLRETAAMLGTIAGTWKSDRMQTRAARQGAPPPIAAAGRRSGWFSECFKVGCVWCMYIAQ